MAVMIFGDSGRAYLTKGYYDQDSEPLITQAAKKIAAQEL